MTEVDANDTPTMRHTVYTTEIMMNAFPLIVVLRNAFYLLYVVSYQAMNILSITALHYSFLRIKWPPI